MMPLFMAFYDSLPLPCPPQGTFGAADAEIRRMVDLSGARLLPSLPAEGSRAEQRQQPAGGPSSSPCPPHVLALFDEGAGPPAAASAASPPEGGVVWASHKWLLESAAAVAPQPLAPFAPALRPL